MLDQILSKLRSIFVVTLVALLIGAFALTFGGPQTEGCSPASEGRVVEVYGNSYYVRDVDAQLRFLGDILRNEQLLQLFDARGAIIEGIIERNLLAEEAKRLGFSMTGDDGLIESMANDQVLLTLGGNAPLPSGPIPFRFHDEDGRFVRENAEGYLRNALGMSPGAFGRWQSEELLAEKMRERIRANVTVTELEIRRAYEDEADRASVRYILFRAPHYRADLPEGIEAPLSFLEENELLIESEYEKNAHRYKNLPPSVHARHILIRHFGEEEKEAARLRAELLLNQLEEGADFAALAREHSDDNDTAPRGGDLGFRSRGQMPSGFEEVAFSLAPGERSEIVESALGFHIIEVLNRREGDVPLVEAKREIASRLYREIEGRARAKAEAEQALEALRSGEKSMDDLEVDYAAREGALAPNVVTSPEFGRGDNPIPQLENGRRFVNTVLALADDEAVAHLFEDGEDVLVYQVIARTRPEADGPDEKTRARIEEELRYAKQEEVLREAVRELREEAFRRGKLRISAPVREKRG